MTSYGIRFINSNHNGFRNSPTSGNLVEVSNNDSDMDELLKYPSIINPHLDTEKPLVVNPNLPSKLCIGVPNRLIAQGLTLTKSEGSGGNSSGGNGSNDSSREARNFKDTMVNLFYYFIKI